MRLLTALLSLFSLASAQFGFFDQMFGQQEQHHGHQQQQNNPSDASHYHARYEGCKLLFPENFLISIPWYLV